MAACNKCGNTTKFECVWVQEYKGHVIIDENNEIIKVIDSDEVCYPFDIKLLKCTVCLSDDVTL